QKTQEIIKQSLEQLGLTVELKSIDGAVFFSSDAGNPDTNRKFYADIEMYTNGPDSPYPIAWAQRFRSDEICQKSNSWAGTNVTRYNNPEYDKLHDQAQVEMDPAKQADLFIAMNDLSVNDFVEIPIVHRGNLIAVSKDLEGYSPASFMSDVYDMKNWRKKS
ncbi:MAG TPA: peptide ABC transporter substrate-binding protein, partial [Thermomicrobiales bacterium]|nr:peptide ABC transporter substrate-binding protein [Thermomicrobiales bacterium]